MKARRLVAAVTAALLTGVLAGCGGGSDDSDRPDGGRPTTAAPGTLRVLASSELSDMKPVLEAAHKATGVRVEATWTGTLDATEQVVTGKADGAYDAIWLSSNDYLRLRPEAAGKIASETPVMTSPVALGVRKETLDRLGWSPEKVTWSQIHRAAADGKLRFGMTDPVRSNSGFSALIALAAGLSGAQGALTDEDVAAVSGKLREFFGGQRLTSGSSGWLADAYTRRGDLDGLINYESVLLSMNRDAGTGLTVLRPADGVLTADYPLTLLTSAPDHAKDSFAALTGYLRGTGAQRAITDGTFRRPVAGSVRPAAGLGAAKRRELPFPASRSVADGLLAGYENTLRRPSRTVYVLDTSGSMEGERLEQLKDSLAQLTGTGTSAPGQRFRDREEVTLMPFGEKVKRTVTHTVPKTGQGAALDRIRADAEGLTASGDTAIYTSLRAAYEHLRERGADGSGDDRFSSIVLMTDGENTTGADAGDFRSFHRGLPGELRDVPVFPIVFGDSDRKELEGIATLTGGRLFDAVRGGSLASAFEEIRGYQ
ncbi:VWA domain-containing protein [Streptomyces pactum]|uniref:VWA domain-containing protein n=1 Tax=Streptomyces pactum TaxID=68249 RepID=A0ABS0NJ24_9ACTN|nr:VWA domain-containing protein [Streptomyces pactum]MBH5335148.1 VWA domain-containing protein [Streptomyces pactum]